MVHDFSNEEPELAKLIDKGLAESGLSANQLAKKVGVDPGWISRVRQGKYFHPSFEKLEQIAKTLRQNPVHYLVALQHDNQEEVPFEKLIGHQLGVELGPEDEKFFRDHVKDYCDELTQHRRDHGCWPPNRQSK